MKPLLYSFLIVTLVIVGCTKPPDYPDEPVIEFVSFSKSAVSQGSDNSDFTYLTISFTDGDGDIGSDSISNFFITDTRDNFEGSPPTIPFVPEQGTGNGISGEIRLQLFNTCCIFPDSSSCDVDANYPTDSVVYEIYIKDRAGNKSNVIKTDPLILICD